MAIENDTIFKKMINEINEAKENQHNQDKLVKHITHVKLLCELFLDEEKPTIEQEGEVTEAELRTMFGQVYASNKPEKPMKRTVTLDDEDANGPSIFDF